MQIDTTTLIKFMSQNIKNVELTVNMLREVQFAWFLDKFVDPNDNNYHLTLQDNRLANPVLSASKEDHIPLFYIYLKTLLENSKVENYYFAYSLKSKHFCLILDEQFDTFHYVKFEDFSSPKSFIELQEQRLEYYSEKELDSFYSLIDFIFNFPISYYRIL